MTEQHLFQFDQTNQSDAVKYIDFVNLRANWGTESWSATSLNQCACMFVVWSNVCFVSSPGINQHYGIRNYGINELYFSFLLDIIFHPFYTRWHHSVGIWWMSYWDWASMNLVVIRNIAVGMDGLQIFPVRSTIIQRLPCAVCWAQPWYFSWSGPRYM